MSQNQPLTLAPDEIQNVLHKLEQALRDHTAWLMHWHRSLVCNLDLGAQHLADDAHHHCDFGHWYYSEDTNYLHAFPVFKKIGQVHKQMHGGARTLFQQMRNGHPITTTDYDDFLELRQVFREHLRVLEKNLQDILFNTDPLTRIFNRKKMIPLLMKELARVEETGESCVICMADLDHFKSINDSHGHPAGDEVLRQVAQFFATHLRPSDLVFRYGGEEFLLCLPDADTYRAIKVLNRLREELSQMEITLPDGPTLRVTGSFGLAEMVGGTTVEQTIEQADKSVYAAKQGGRNRVCAWGVATSECPCNPGVPV